MDTVVTWEPFFLNRNTPPEGEDMMEHLKKKYGEAAVARFSSPGNPLDTAAAKCGITFNKSRRVINTLDGHRVIEFCREKDPSGELSKKAMEVMFRKYFSEGLDLSKTEELASVGEEVGVGKEEIIGLLGTDKYKSEIMDKDTSFKSSGVSGVPFFIVGSGSNRVSFSGAQPPDVIAELLEDMKK